MDRKPFYGAAAITRLKKGVPHILLVKQYPRNMKFRDQVQIKCPGGTSDFSIDEAVRRETTEETGLVICPTTQLTQVYSKVIPGVVPHQKAGVLVHRDHCYGELSKVAREDEDSTVCPPFEISLEDAIKNVFYTERNFFHLHFLVSLWAMLEGEMKEETLKALVA